MSNDERLPEADEHIKGAEDAKDIDDDTFLFFFEKPDLLSVVIYGVFGVFVIALTVVLLTFVRPAPPKNVSLASFVGHTSLRSINRQACCVKLAASGHGLLTIHCYRHRRARYRSPIKVSTGRSIVRGCGRSSGDASMR